MPATKEQLEQKRKNEEDRETQKNFEAAIAHNMSLYGVRSRKSLAIMLHIGDDTLKKKAENFNLWRVDQLKKLYEVLHFTDEQKLKL